MASTLRFSKATTFAELNTAANKAAAWKRAFEPIAEVSNKAGLVWAKAERYPGSELAAAPMAKGAAVKGVGKRGSKGEPRCESTPKEMGVAKKRSARAQDRERGEPD